MPASKKPQNIINHFGFVLDKSSSMDVHTRKVIEVVDNQIRHLATRSKEMDQETRVSIWTFADPHSIECVVWDMDVLRLPSIAEFYQPYGNTAFIDAMLKSIADLKTTSQIYGDHSFLLYVVTDGQENRSIERSPRVLSEAIRLLADNWTVAALVPDHRGVAEAKRYGFPAGNIQIWDATTEAGLEEAAQSILRSSDSYMTARSTGLKSTANLFDMSAAAVNKQTIQAAGLTPLDPTEYLLVPVVFGRNFQDGDDRIDTFTAAMGHQYVTGRGYYQLTLAPVKVQVQKDIAIVEKKTGKVYVGKNARALLGLPDMTVTLKAEQNPEYDIFIQSTSLNRKLLLGSRYLYLTPNITYARGTVLTAPPVKAAPKVAKMPLAPSTVARRAAAAAVVAGSKKAKLDLTAPVYAKGGKALWAGRACPDCKSGANKRCVNSYGSPIEKPHAARKN